MEDANPLASGVAGTSQRQPATSDFVKKLYKILEDPAFYPIISWGAKGDCFVVKDVNEFSKKILPPVYNHSNFASFVRQLNKYDFHKIRNTDDDTSGSHSWSFYHPDFRANGRDALGKIKRKAPPLRVPPVAEDGQQRETVFAAGLSCSPPSSPAVGPLHVGIEDLSNEVQRLRDANEDLNRRIRIMENDHRDVLVSLVDFQNAMVKQNELMHSIRAYVVGNCLQSPLKSEFIPLQFPQLSSPQSTQSQAPPPYSTDTQQSRYDGRSGEYGMSSSGPSNPSGAIYTPEYPATGDVPMQDAVQLPSPGLPTSHPSSPWSGSLSPITIYPPGSQAFGCGVSALPLSPISPGGSQELGGVSNVGMSLGGVSEDVNPYFVW